MSSVVALMDLFSLWLLLLYVLLDSLWYLLEANSDLLVRCCCWLLNTDHPQKNINLAYFVVLRRSRGNPSPSPVVLLGPQ